MCRVAINTLRGRHASATIVIGHRYKQDCMFPEAQVRQPWCYSTPGHVDSTQSSRLNHHPEKHTHSCFCSYSCKFMLAEPPHQALRHGFCHFYCHDSRQEVKALQDSGRGGLVTGSEHSRWGRMWYKSSHAIARQLMLELDL